MRRPIFLYNIYHGVTVPCIRTVNFIYTLQLFIAIYAGTKCNFQFASTFLSLNFHNYNCEPSAPCYSELRCFHDANPENDQEIPGHVVSTLLVLLLNDELCNGWVSGFEWLCTRFFTVKGKPTTSVGETGSENIFGYDKYCVSLRMCTVVWWILYEFQIVHCSLVNTVWVSDCAL